MHAPVPPLLVLVTPSLQNIKTRVFVPEEEEGGVKTQGRGTGGVEGEE